MSGAAGVARGRAFLAGLVGSLACHLFGWPAGRLADWLAGRSVLYSRLAGWGKLCAAVAESLAVAWRPAI